MKQNYIFLLAIILFFFATSFTFAQTYNVDTPGGNCPLNTGIDKTFTCSTTNNNINLGTFTDTNIAGQSINSISAKVYIACNGTCSIFLNGTLLGSLTVTGTGCSCQAIAAVPGITNTLTVVMTPEIAAAYVVGGVNTLSLTKTSAGGNQMCVYGADVTVTAGTLGTETFNVSSLNLFPNPASETIKIEGLEDVSPYVIYTSTGAEIITGVTSKNENIDVKKLSAGLYFLKLQDGQTFKFVKK